MKINEKNLSNFAVSKSFVDKEGYLTKRGEVNKAPQKRWFVLKGNLLFYFEKRTEKELPVGVIILEGCTIELAENDDNAFSFKIMFHGTGNRSYVLGAESQESMEQWMKSLACASYDYMKLMVADLQRQLDELDGTVPSESPQVPPRRQNPFNKPNAPSSLQPYPSPDAVTLQETTPTTRSSSNKNRVSFREIHKAFGLPILRDRSEYRHRVKQNSPSSPLYHTPLISL